MIGMNEVRIFKTLSTADIYCVYNSLVIDFYMINRDKSSLCKDYNI